jgi:hypothetical protein
LTKTKPSVLLYDIETSHNLGAFFQLYDDHTPYTNIIKERYIICAAWQWLGESKIHSVSVLDDNKRFKRDPNDDTYVVKRLHEVLSNADAVIGHNSARFDDRYVRTRALFHGLEPLPPFKSVDTLRIAKRKFMFNSNRLDYLGKFLGLGTKQKTSPGLWLRVLGGEAKAVKEMVRYNKQDVHLLREVFLKLRAHDSTAMNLGLFHGVGCPYCGSPKTQSRGWRYTKTRAYKRFQCQSESCGGWFSKTRSELGVETAPV